jgi:hypothetical protein
MNELEILRKSVDNMEKISGKELVNNPDVKKIIRIVEDFLKKKERICYGGTAINNILPKDKQFYDEDIELPDYDFFSPDPLNDSKELSDIYYKNGFKNVEAKSGSHYGTFKVFVNYLPVADISFLEIDLYTELFKSSIKKKKILYAPPNYLRMGMYLELSRPKGDLSRWEKVYKRLLLLNQSFPIKDLKCNIELKDLYQKKSHQNKISNHKFNIYDKVKEFFIKKECVFMGGYALSLYLKNIPSLKLSKDHEILNFDVITNNPYKISNELQILLKKYKIYSVVKEHKGLGEIIPLSYQIIIDNKTFLNIYKPIACHSYNILNKNNNEIRIATIDTMFSFFFAFLYNPTYKNKDLLICIIKYLYEVQTKYKFSKKGLMSRFSINCYGEELHTREKSREKKSEMYKKFKNNKNDEWEWWFLNYSPVIHKNKNNKFYPKKSELKINSKTKKFNNKNNQFHPKKKSKLKINSKTKKFNNKNKKKTNISKRTSYQPKNLFDIFF